MSSSASGAEPGAARPGRAARLVGALVLVAATGGAGALLLPHLVGQVREARLVPPDHPWVRLDREITAEFGMENPVAWVIAARAGTVWTPALLARVQELTRAVFTIPGVVAPDVVSLASPNLRDLRITDEGLEPVYLMGTVPETPEAVAVLRRRVEGDANYRGNLVSLDGRAAMVAANFAADADAAAVGAAALALRDRFRDAAADVHVVGAPVMRVLAPEAGRRAAVPAALVVLGALAVFLCVLGPAAGLAALLAAALACAWTVLAVGAAGALVLPWSLLALVPTALVAVALALARTAGAAARGLAGGALVLGHVALALVAGVPAGALGVAGAAGTFAALVAGGAVRTLLAPRTRAARGGRWLGAATLLLVGGALLGLARLAPGFALVGYGERYLAGPAAADLHALRRLFAPPSALAIRVRGTPGFVASPAVLGALDGLGTAARADPAVRGVVSLADVVKLVNRAFNDDRPEFQVIPEDRAMVTRYLTLAYSPNFRRFLDRALARTALWVYVDGERPADLARVLARLEAALARRPVPEAEVDVVGGDGAVLLLMARTARRLALGAGALLLMAALVVGVVRGRAAGGRVLGAGLTAGVIAAGGLGWLRVPIDLVALPAVVAAATSGAALGALAATAGAAGTLRRLAFALGGAAVPALVVPHPAARIVGMLLLGPAVGAVLATRSPRHEGHAEVPDPAREERWSAS